jgi:hypothetical protein
MVVCAHTGAAAAIAIPNARTPMTVRRLIEIMSTSSVLFTGTHASACKFFVYVYKMRQKKYNVNQVNMIFLSGK